MLSENAKKVLTYLQDIDNADVTVHDVSEAIGLPVNSITGTFNSFVKKGLWERVEAEVEIEDGSHKKVLPPTLPRFFAKAWILSVSSVVHAPFFKKNPSKYGHWPFTIQIWF